MSHLLESLGRGLLRNLADAFPRRWPVTDADRAELQARLAQCPTSADLMIQIAGRQLADGKPRAAQLGFRRALELSPESQAARLGLASALDAADDIEGAVRELRVACEADPKDPAVPFAMGLCCERLGRPGEARDLYEQAVSRCPDLRNAHERLAALALRDGDAERAARGYRQLAERIEHDADLPLILGSLHLRAGDADAALTSFQQALLVEPHVYDAPALDRRPQSMPDVLLALQQVEALAEEHPSALEYRIHLGDLYVKLGDDERAVAAYQSALAAHPTLLEATVKLGTQHLRRGRYMRAAEAFNRAATLNDRTLAAFVGLGVAQCGAGRERDGEASFGLAASLAPNSALLFAEALRLRLRAEEVAGPEAHEEEPQAPSAESPSLQELTDRLDETLRERRRDPTLHFRRGLVAWQLGAFHEALAGFARATELCPCFAPAQIQLGAALWGADERRAAQACFERAMTHTEDEIEQHYELALLSTRPARFDLALEQVAESSESRSPRRELEEIITLALQNAGALDRAAASWQSLSELAEMPPPSDAWSDAPGALDA